VPGRTRSDRRRSPAPDSRYDRGVAESVLPLGESRRTAGRRSDRERATPSIRSAGAAVAAAAGAADALESRARSRSPPEPLKTRKLLEYW